ncbi:MAG: hypothetical protein ACO1QR_10520 [Chthoniobacteraceae bacterium]
MTNKIDITLTTEQAAAGSAAVAALETAFPYLISLTPSGRSKILRMGERTEGFVRTALDAAEQFPNAIPPSVDLAHLSRDLELREHLAGIELALGSMLQKVQDTRRVAGSDLYSGALDIYQALKRHGVDEGVDVAVNQLRQRFRRAAAKPSGDAPAS